MKKYSLLILTFVTFGLTSVMAQSENALNIGAKVGGNLNQLSQSGLHTGVNGGAFVLFNLSDLLGIQGELGYNQNGGLRNDYSLDVASPPYLSFTNRSITFHAVRLGAGLKVNLGSGDDALKPKVHVGGSYAYNTAVFEKRDLITSTPITGGTLEARAEADYENVGSEFEAHQFGGFLGIALDYSLSNGKIFSTEVRYERIFNELHVGYPAAKSGEAFANTISINFAYSIF
ncbi:MAG: outer membrane beta-barrel protein [Cyclobacteriaceae bacterium]